MAELRLGPPVRKNFQIGQYRKLESAGGRIRVVEERAAPAGAFILFCAT